MEATIVKSVYDYIAEGDGSQGCTLLKLPNDLLTNIFKEYAATDFGIEIHSQSDGDVINQFNTRLQAQEDIIFNNAVSVSINRIFIQDNFKRLFQTGQINKKIRFEYRSHNALTSIQYSNFINTVFKVVADKHPRITDNFESEAALVYEIYKELESIKFIITYFPYFSARDFIATIPNAYAFIRDNPQTAPYFDAFNRRLLQPIVIYNEFKAARQERKPLYDQNPNEISSVINQLKTEFANPGNLWEIGLMVTVPGRNRRVEFLKQYEVFVNFVNVNVRATILKVQDQNECEAIISQVTQLLNPFLPDEAFRQMRKVYQMFKDGNITISAECQQKLTILDGLHVDEWQQVDIELQKSMPISLDDFTEQIVKLDETIQSIEPSFYTSNKFGFLYLGYGDVGLAALHATSLNFLKLAEPIVLNPFYIAAVRQYQENKIQVIKNGLAVTAINIINRNLSVIKPDTLVGCQVCKNPDENFLCSTSTTPQKGSNFIGRYISLVSSLLKLPFLTIPPLRKWALKASSDPRISQFPQLFPQLDVTLNDKKGIDIQVARFLILAFATGAVTKESFAAPKMSDPFFNRPDVHRPDVHRPDVQTPRFAPQLESPIYRPESPQPQPPTTPGADYYILSQGNPYLRQKLGLMGLIEVRNVDLSPVVVWAFKNDEYPEVKCILKNTLLFPIKILSRSNLDTLIGGSYPNLKKHLAQITTADKDKITVGTREVPYTIRMYLLVSIVDGRRLAFAFDKGNVYAGRNVLLFPDMNDEFPRGHTPEDTLFQIKKLLFGIASVLAPNMEPQPGSRNGFEVFSVDFFVKRDGTVILGAVNESITTPTNTEDPFLKLYFDWIFDAVFTPVFEHVDRIEPIYDDISETLHIY